MRILERIFFALIGLLLITLITVLLVVPEAVSDGLLNLANVALVVRIAVVLVLDLLVLAFLYLNLRSKSPTSSGLIVKAPGALADISVDSARSFILSAVQKVPDVVSTEAKLEAVRGKAKIEMDVRVRGRDVNIPRKQQEINQALKQVINKQLGLDILDRPQVHIHLEDDKPKVAPAVAVPPAAPKVETPPVIVPARKEPPLVTPSINPSLAESDALKSTEMTNHKTESTDDTVIP